MAVATHPFERATTKIMWLVAFLLLLSLSQVNPGLRMGALAITGACLLLILGLWLKARASLKVWRRYAASVAQPTLQADGPASGGPAA